MKGQNGEASEYVIHGDALKKIVRKSRRRPMPFAFVPTFGDDESMFAVHKKRKPEVIARRTKLESGQSRIAYGTFMVIGKTMVLTCIRELPSIAKKLKKHMREERIPLNIRVLDMLGQELEADIDDTDDGDDPLGPDDDDDDDDDDTAAPARTPHDAVGDRIETLRPAIVAAGGMRGDRLRDMLSALIKALADGQRIEADRILSTLEDEVRALMNSVDRPQVTPTRATPDRIPERPRPEPPAPETDPPDRANALRLARRIATLRRRVEALEGEAASRLLAALGVAAKAVRSGETEAATDAIARISAALDRVEALQTAGKTRS
jgi:hypothetical protein